MMITGFTNIMTSAGIIAPLVKNINVRDCLDQVVDCLCYTVPTDLHYLVGHYHHGDYVYTTENVDVISYFKTEDYDITEEDHDHDHKHKHEHEHGYVVPTEEDHDHDHDHDHDYVSPVDYSHGSSPSYGHNGYVAPAPPAEETPCTEGNSFRTR
jgi:hypothetical protein